MIARPVLDGVPISPLPIERFESVLSAEAFEASGAVHGGRETLKHRSGGVPRPGRNDAEDEQRRPPARTEPPAPAQRE